MKLEKNLKYCAAILSMFIAASSYSIFTENTKVYAEVTANPVISRNCPAYSNSGNTQGVNDEHYFSFWNAPAGSYIAYDLSDTPEEQRKEVIVVWYNATGAYDYTILENQSSMNCPSGYTIEVNSASGGEYPETGWETVVTVKENTCHSRQHAVNMEGYNWIRMNISESDGKADGQISMQMDIHNVSDGISDSWIFYGDSITACGMNNCYGTGFATYVNRIDERYFPVQENGGVGGITSTHGVKKIDEWLSHFSGKYVSIAFGTNDSWGNQTGAEKYYENTKYMIEKIIECGKTPILPTIPYSLEEGVNKYLDQYNAMVRKLYEEYPEIIKGPDFEELFRKNPELLSHDGVHPNDTGYDTMRQTWANLMYETVYKSASSVPETGLKGDVNSDGSITAKDMVELIKYLTGQNCEVRDGNADLNNDGILNVADLILLKNILIQQNNPADS